MFAREAGSIAAPTAGLHFTEAILRSLDEAGVERTTITLHVGYGTFKPVRATEVEAHTVDPERYAISEDGALHGEKYYRTVSEEFAATTDRIKGLQERWKGIGPVPRKEADAIWTRFRAACDHFFERRKVWQKQEDAKRAENLKAKEALCARAEELSQSTEWESTSNAFKALQAEWKAIGPVPRSKADALWARFRAPCDRFFERYKHRGDIEREARVAGRMSLIQEMEALLPAPPAAAPETIPAAPAGAPETSPWTADTAPAPDPPPAEPEVTQARPEAPRDLPQILRSAVERWKQGTPLPRDRAAELEERFRGAVDRLVLAYPEAVKGSAWDVSENIRRMEELCAQVEKLVTMEETAGDSTVSPAARLAAMWVEAMAANTIGGGVKDDAKERAAAEEVRRAQTLWQRIGYVPAEPRRTLTARFSPGSRGSGTPNG